LAVYKKHDICIFKEGKKSQISFDIYKYKFQKSRNSLISAKVVKVLWYFTMHDHPICFHHKSLGFLIGYDYDVCKVEVAIVDNLSTTVLYLITQTNYPTFSLD
jgi:hypothetical protein